MKQNYQITFENVSLNVDISDHKRLFSKQKYLQYKSLLSEISFDIREGDKVGLIGRNGSGKSTLLRTISNIYTPTIGKIKITGKVLAFLGGRMFDENFRGRDFIFHSLQMLGLKKNEISKNFKLIKDFTEFSDNILNQTIDKYSDGMRSRLSFGCMLFSKPDILLLDEVIGTGDKFFIDKSKIYLERFIDEIPIIMLASHNEEIINSYCNKIIYLYEGKIKYIGETKTGFDIYNNDFKE